VNAIGVLRAFRASHHLIGADFGPEGVPHFHDYRVEWTLSGRQLDSFGFLVDLRTVEAVLDDAVRTVSEKCLNELPGWEGLNPSVERLSMFVSAFLVSRRESWDPLHRTRGSVVKIWEHDQAWASWEESL